MSPSTLRANQRVAYFNGEWVPEADVKVPYRDKSFIYGDGCFDMTRTFNGRPFKVKEHMDRLGRSLKYLRIEIPQSLGEMAAITEEIVARNKHLLAKGDDFWIGQRISRGVRAVGDEGWDHTGPNVIVDCTPLPFAQRASHYRDGIHVLTPSIRRTPPSSLSPRVKTHNYLNMIVGELEVKDRDPNGWAVLLDENGNLCEGIGSNVFIVKDGRLLTPRGKYVLEGVSRETVIELAGALKIPVEEADIDLYDAYTADEMFLTSTSLCLCGVSKVNGATIADGRIPGPITKKLLAAYSELVGCDIEKQYLSRL